MSYYFQNLSRIRFDVLFDHMIVARCMKHTDHNKNAQLLEGMDLKND